MKKSRLVWAAVLVLLLVVNLILTAPARLFYLALPGDQLLLRGLTGTVWNGSASSAMLRLPQGYLQLGVVQWSLKPLSLLLLSPHLAVSSEWGNQNFAGELVLRGQRDLDVRNLEAQLAAPLLSNFAPLAMDDMFSLQVEELELRDGLPYSGNGRLVLQDGGWRSPRGLVLLGSYALDFKQEPKEALEGKVITLSGPLQANGSVQLKERHYAVDILLSGEDSLDAQLSNMLGLIATPEDGRYRIKMGGDF